VEEVVTGIRQVNTCQLQQNDNRWYTLDGRQINKPTQKGIYIRNHKKIIIK